MKKQRENTLSSRPPWNTVVDKPLTQKQQAFVLWFTTPGLTYYNQTQSAKAAGLGGKDAKESACAVYGSKMIRIPKIAKAIRAAFHAQFEAAGSITVEHVLRCLEQVRTAAMRTSDYTAVLAALRMEGQHLKMFVQKIEMLHTLDDATTDELQGLLTELAGKVDGLDYASLFGGNAPAPGGDPDRQRATTTH